MTRELAVNNLFIEFKQRSAQQENWAIPWIHKYGANQRACTLSQTFPSASLVTKNQPCGKTEWHIWALRNLGY